MLSARVNLLGYGPKDSSNFIAHWLVIEEDYVVEKTSQSCV